MKKATLILMVLGMAAAACAPQRNRGQGFAMTPIAEMAVGTLKLQGTTDAITKEQATALLPMWEVYKQLESSDTAAPQEIEGLTQQIQETMTEAQRQSIKGMKLGPQDMFSVMQQGQGGATRPFSGGTGNGSNRQGAGRTNGGNFFVGGPPDGGFGPGGGFGGAGGTGTNRNSQNGSTAQAATQQLTQRMAQRVPTPVLNALIAYLKTTAGAQVTAMPTPAQ